ncbi:F-box domain-containing protein [Hirschfeldia incana]|nr:F-box domain-containing protein [Hirschfeldia incana]
MKRKRELANGRDVVKTTDAIIQTTASSSITVSKQNIPADNSDLFPTDLLMEILKRFPVKTLARLMCVSKLWASTIRRQEFKKLWSSHKQRSSTLIFAFKRDKGYGQDCFFFSSLQTKNQGQPSVTTATYLTSHPGDLSYTPSVHGLICYGPPSNITVYNATTRRSITLPKIASQRTCLYHYLGYDPIDSVYKMLCMTKGKHEIAQELHVMTLGDEISWRMVEDCPPHYSPESLHICIDGVLYYGASFGTCTTTSVIGKDRGVLSFDVRSEKFDVIRVPQGRARKFTSMTRYNGKLALMYTVYGKIGLWVLEDAARHKWSSMLFDLPRLSGYNTKFQVFCAVDDGDDAGEFVLAPRELHESPFYVLYYDPKKKRVRKVVIEGITEHEELPLWDKDWKRKTMSIFPGQVENLMFL